MKTKVMLIIPEMSVGGAQRSIAKLSVELSKYATIFFVLFNRGQPIAYPFGGELYSLDVYPSNTWHSKVFAFLKRIQRLKKLKKSLGVNVCVSFLEGADYINVLSKTGEKVVLSIRGSKIHDEIMQSYFFWLRKKILIPILYRKADQIVAVNTGITNELTQIFRIPPEKVLTIYNFYDFKEIRNLANEPDPSISSIYDKPTLITSGRLAPEKRLTFLISIFILLKNTYPKLRFIFVGDGPEATALFQFCKEKNLSFGTDNFTETIPDVLFLGNQTNVFKHVANASVYLLNSSSEGFPNGLVEAMICGVPVVAADCPYGPREILAPHLESKVIAAPIVSSSGILMPLENSERTLRMWADTVGSLLKDYEVKNRVCRGAQERVREFDKDKIISQWLEVIGRPALT